MLTNVERVFLIHRAALAQEAARATAQRAALTHMRVAVTQARLRADAARRAQERDAGRWA
jgi:hypothetical protein